MADVAPVDYVSSVGKLRSVIGDVDSTAYILHDPEIQVALDLNAGDIMFAASDLLLRLAVKASLGGTVKLLDLQISGADGAKMLTALSREFQNSAIFGDEAFEVFQVNEQDSPFAWDRYLERRYREISTPVPFEDI